MTGPGPEHDRLIVHLAVDITSPEAAVRLVEQVNHALRGVRTAVCSGWLHQRDGPDGGGGGQLPQPHLTAWLDLDCALVLTRLEPTRALLELHITTRPAHQHQPSQHQPASANR